MKVRGVLSSSLLALTLVVSTLAGCTAKEPEATTWRFSSGNAQTSYVSPWVLHFIEEVKERTDGQLIIVPFFSSELGVSSPDFLRATSDGLFECCELLTSQTVGDFGLPSIIDLPFLIGNSVEYALVADQVEPILEDKLSEDWEVVPLVFFPVHPQIVESKVPIESMDDLRGLKIRTSSVGQSSLWQAAGASPVTIAMPEIYTSLQRGVIDAVNTAAGVYLALKLFEQAKYVYTIDVSNGLLAYIVNRDAYDALPVAHQQALHDAAEATRPVIFADLAAGYQGDLLKCRDAGASVQPLPPEMEAQLRAFAPSIWDAWGELHGAEAQAMLDGIRQTLHK